MKRRIVLWSVAAAVALLSYGGYLAWRAHRNLVTLEVRNMDLREVVSKIEWQTWERIIVHKELQGKITLNVNDAQLEDVLNIIGEQCEARWTALYPLYTSGDKLVSFKKVARGDLPVEGSSWTNLQVRFGGRGFGGPGGPGGFMGFGDTVRAQSKLVNLEFANKDLGFATLALARYSQSQVVPENGTDGTFSVHLKQVPYEDAVATIAKQVHRKWDQFYALQPGFGFGRGRDGGGRDGGRDFGRRRDGDTNRVSDPLFADQLAEQRREQFEAQRQRQQEAQLATMTPDEQKKMEEQRKQFEEMRNLSPEERQQKFQEMASKPEFQQRMQQRIMGGVMNTTPEQRVERAQRRLEWQKRRQQQQNGR